MIEDLIEEANAYNNMKMSHMSTSDRVEASRLGKRIVLDLNKFFKESKDPKIMDVMKMVSEKKKKIESRLKGRPEV